ncbi:hypothetical protein ACQP2U_16025 [Nocardia sp. CA-084685]|uniref:hypothetical protein n=1 Tax=Nocardia sp. CA-084685 TaxID=3239970 RepID=UPI003D99EF6D
MRIPANRMPTAAAYRPDSRDAGIRRYFGLVQFALITDVPASRLSAWRHGTHTWVPSPDIQVGDHPGWSMACIDAWFPGGDPFLRPPVVQFADTAAIRARYHGMPTSTLWACIGDGTIPRPVVWVDNRPGWLL